MSNTPLIFAAALAGDTNIQSILRAMEAASSPQPQPRPRIISLTDSEGDPDHRPSLPRLARKPKPHTPSPTRVFVIEGTPESDEEYQEYLVQKSRRRAAREIKRAADRGRSAERHAQIADDRQRSAEAHERLARRAGKLPEKRYASSGSYVDPEFDTMLANLTLDHNGDVVDTPKHSPPHPPTLPKSPTPTGPPRVYNVRSPERSGPVETWPLSAHLTQGVSGASVKRVGTADRSEKPYVVFAGTKPGIYNSWSEVEPLVSRVRGNSQQRYRNRFEAEQAWLLANALGTVQILDKKGNHVGTPTVTFPPEVMQAFLDLPDDFLEREWYVVTKGKRPGIYPTWNFAASQTQSIRRAVYVRYNSKREALAAYETAVAQGVIEYL